MAGETPQTSSTRLLWAGPPLSGIRIIACSRPDQLDPWARSFLKLNSLVYEPYDALDLQKILRIRVDKALVPNAVDAGVIEKIAALSSREHGDARRAVALLAKSAYLAEKAGTKVTQTCVDEAVTELDKDRYLTLLGSAPAHFQAALGGIIESVRHSRIQSVGSGEAYDAYTQLCQRSSLSPLTSRAFGDLVGELDIASLIRSRVLSKGRYGRSRQISLDLPTEAIDRIYETILTNLGAGRPPKASAKPLSTLARYAGNEAPG
jgi:cell division control protein 6